MLAGSDRRHGDKKRGLKPRSDTIILMRVDPKKGIALLSLPRDLKVSIPGHGTDKINAAYTLGGPKLAIKTVKQLTGLEINHYIDVNFRGFQQAVDEIGCVYTDVDRRYFNDNSGLGYGQQYAVDQRATGLSEDVRCCVRSSTSATGTPTRTSAAAPASRTSCATSGSRSPSAS